MQVTQCHKQALYTSKTQSASHTVSAKAHGRPINASRRDIQACVAASADTVERSSEHDHVQVAATAAERDTPDASDDAAVQQSTLRLLEWPAICKQLSRFCSTTLGADACSASGVHIGTTMDECQRLQQETREASVAQLPLASVQDLSEALEPVRSAVQKRGSVALAVQQLAAVGRTLRACLAVRAAAVQTNAPPREVSNASQSTADIRSGNAPGTRQTQPSDRASPPTAHNLQPGVASTTENGNASDQAVSVSADDDSAAPEGAEMVAAHAAQEQQGDAAGSNGTHIADVVAESPGISGNGAAPGSSLSYPALAAHAARISERALAKLVDVFEAALDLKTSDLRDNASAKLQQIRRAKRENAQALDKEMKKWSTQLYQSKASDTQQSVMRRGRECCSVKAGRSEILPKGSVTLGKSQTGATLYIEPKTAQELNNKAISYTEALRAEEERVLAELCGYIGAALPAIDAAMAAVIQLDLAHARAGYAKWLGGTEPQLISQEEAQQSSIAHLHGVCHPVLLARALPALPPPPQPENVYVPGRPLDDPSKADYAAPKAPRKRRRHNEKAQQSPEDESADLESDEEGDSAGFAAQQQEPLPSSFPRPVGLRVPRGIKVAAVTGPNTGGKTAALKTLGVSVLMAQAGMHIRLQPDTGPDTEDSAASLDAPKVAVFDKVLADLGDTQSLEQNLSTFSGHVVRTRDILAAATSSSLVLLDEVGSGTDPAEGASLAIALLRAFSAKAAFTFTTTHYAEVKDEAQRHDDFVSAAVEFDVETLQPTYKLIWDSAGLSNALAVASALGFDQQVVNRGAVWKGKLATLRQSPAKAEKMSTAVEDQIEQAVADEAELRATLERTRSASDSAASRMTAADTALSKAQRAVKKAQTDADSELRSLRALVTRVKNKDVAVDDAIAHVQRIVEQLPSHNSASRRLLGLELGAVSEKELKHVSASQNKAGWKPRSGQTVILPKVGGAKAVVVTPPANAQKGTSMQVSLGGLVMSVKLADVRRVSGGSK